MGKYTGIKCIVCSEKFQDADDVVVCPECGTPYHRTCWEASRKCVNTALHAVGGSWQSIQDERRLKSGGQACPHCGFVNLPGDKTCAACQNPLETPESAQMNDEFVFNLPEDGQFYFKATDPCCGMSPDEEIEGERLGDVASFVGKNTLYYIPLFKRFRDSGRKTSLNIPCVLFPYFYFANRKMWFMAILSSLVWIICGLPGTLLGMIQTLQDSTWQSAYSSMPEVLEMSDKLAEFLKLHESVFSALETPLFLVGLVVRALLCLFGNYLYFRFVLKSVRKIREISPSQSVREALLVSEGGTNIWNVLGCLGLYFGIWILIYMILGLLFV